MKKAPNKFGYLKVLVILLLFLASVCGIITSLSSGGIISTEGSMLTLFDLRKPEQSVPEAVVSPSTLPVSRTDVGDTPEIIEPEAVHPPEPVPVSGDVRSRLDEISEKYNCISVQAAIINDGYVTDTYCYGYADSDEQKPINDDTKVRVASLTKVVVGMAAMRAQEEGYIDLDDNLSEKLGYSVYSPLYPSEPLYLRSFLTHTACINVLADIKGRSLQNFLQSGGTYLYEKPNTLEAWGYSNPGINAAGGIIETATNQPLYTYTKDKFFEPLGIDGSLFAGLLNDRDNIATLYYGNHKRSSSVNGQLSNAFYEEPAASCYNYSGGLTISAKDYARLLCVLLRDGEYGNKQILKPESVDEMQQTNFELEGFHQCIILRHIGSMYGGRDLYYHTGDSLGVLAFASYDEAAKEGVVIVTVGANNNARDDFNVPKVCAKYAEYIYSEVLDGASAE